VDPERLFLEHLSAIERIVRSVTRRHHLAPQDAEDFRGLVRLRLIKDHFRIIRQYEGRGSMATYLTAVVTRLFLDYRNQVWGRWRPSARARALGPDAVALERLVSRDGHRLEEAVQILLGSGQVSTSEAGIRELWSRLPLRIVARSYDEEPAGSTGNPRHSRDPVADAEDAVVAKKAFARVMSALTSEDRMLLELHFGRGVPLVHIARAWKISRATIMRRQAQALAACRTSLEAAGLTSDRLEELLREGVIELPLISMPSAETVGNSGRLKNTDKDDE
jgi:RNA polymerase sigma factor (sigma-70 family)